MMKVFEALVLSVLVAVTLAFPTTNKEEYDYIIVGGGAAGLIAADRFSETGKSVLLLERGPPSTWKHGGRNGPEWAIENKLTRYDIPGLCNQIWMDSAGIACEDIDQMAGCVLGGGTAINAGLFFKPTDRDWDYNFPAGWKAKDMVAATNRVFKRIPATDTPSQDGKRYFQESYNVLSSALSKAGWKSITANQSPNEKNRTFAHTPFMYINGERGGPLATYLASAKARSNFKLAVNSTVERVVRKGGVVTGVEVIPFGEGGINGTINVKQKTGKVILAAGAFGTTKILFRSGIGPVDQLEVVKKAETDKLVPEKDWINLPVGNNTMDHTNTDLVVSHPDVVPYDYYAAWDEPIQQDKENYIEHRSGPLAGAAPSPNTMFWEAIPGIDGIERQLQWTARVEGSLGAEGDNLITLSQYLGTGYESRGKLTISPYLNLVTSKSPYASTEADIDAQIKGVASIVAALNATGSGFTFVFPPEGVNAVEYVKTYLGGKRSNHWLGTSKLGKDDGRKPGGTAVVDTDTKVYGTENLFVIDASIFPGHVTHNPSAAIMIAAERAVERILRLRN